MSRNYPISDIERYKTKRTNTKSGFRLDMGEKVFDFESRFFKDFLKLLNPEDFSVYPKDDLENKVKDKIAILNNLSSNEVSIDGGSDQVIKNIFQAFVCHNQKIIINSPAWPMYEVYAKILDIDIKKIMLNENFKINFHNIYNCIDNDTALVVLTSPPSPYGSVELQSSLEDLANFLLEKKIFLLIDEAYYEFSDLNCLELIKQYKNVILTRTFSKAWGAAGCRVGYALSSKENIKQLEKVRLTYPISNVSLKFINYLLDHSDLIANYIQETIRERNIIKNKLELIGVKVFPTETNIMQFKADENKLKKISEILNKYNVAYRSEINETQNKIQWIRIHIGQGLEQQNYMKEIFNLKSI